MCNVQNFTRRNFFQIQLKLAFVKRPKNNFWNLHIIDKVDIVLKYLHKIHY